MIVLMWGAATDQSLWYSSIADYNWDAFLDKLHISGGFTGLGHF
jgi:hypothetical protein